MSSEDRFWLQASAFIAGFAVACLIMAALSLLRG
jgi:hypothetical protein